MASRLAPGFSCDLKARIGEVSLMSRGKRIAVYLYRESAGRISRRELALLDRDGATSSRWDFPDEVFALGFTDDGALAVVHSDLEQMPHTICISGFDASGEMLWSYPYPGSADFLFFDALLDAAPTLLVDSLDVVRCFRGGKLAWERDFRRGKVRALTGVLARSPASLKGVWNLLLLPDGGAMVLTSRELFRLDAGGETVWGLKLGAPYKMLSAGPGRVLVSSDGYYGKRPERTVLLTDDGDELWRRSLPLPLAAMGWSPFDDFAALALYTEPDDGGLAFVDASGAELATHTVQGWPHGLAFAPGLAALACEDALYAFDGRGASLGRLELAGLEAFGSSPDGGVLAAGAGGKLRCWELRRA